MLLITMNWSEERGWWPQPVPPPSPLAVWILSADETDEMWQADLGMASGHCCLCQLGRLLDQPRMITEWQSNRKASFSGEGGICGCPSRQKPLAVVAWAELWLSDLSDTRTPLACEYPSVLKSLSEGFVKIYGRISASWDELKKGFSLRLKHNFSLHYSYWCLFKSIVCCFFFCPSLHSPVCTKSNTGEAGGRANSHASSTSRLNWTILLQAKR